MNETEARRLCEEQFAACAVNNIDGKPIQEDKYLEDCISDLMVSTVKHISWVFGDDLPIYIPYFSIEKTNVVEAILMSRPTYKVCFYGELTKIIL